MSSFIAGRIYPYVWQKIYDERMIVLEDTLKKLQDTVEEVRPYRQSYTQAEGMSAGASPWLKFNPLSGTLRKERKQLEDMKDSFTEQIKLLHCKMGKAACDIAILQSQWKVNKTALNELGEQLAPTQEVAHALARKLAEMEEHEDSIWIIVKDTQERLHELCQAHAHDAYTSGYRCSSLSPSS